MANRGGSLAVPEMPQQNVSYRRDGFRKHPQTIGTVVSGHVVGDEPEERCQRARAAESLGTGQLRDGVDLVAQTSSGDGSAWQGPIVRRDRSG